ncbi:MAG: tetratricopeptide repeat protein, partial [Vicinamibacterales bacterium]
MNFGDSLPLLSSLVMLLLGLAVGKAWERYKLRDGRWIDRRRARDSHHYVLGLNFLVSNQIDLAIEELSQAARVDSDALEIHLILGNVHRERGQVSRAIQVHQALLQRPKLTKVEHAYILLCLGLDFKRGGFVDRALEAFNEVIRMDPANQYALLYLQKLHEEQHQWADALRIRKQLVALSGPDTQPRNQAILGFLENELGTESLAGGDRGQAARHFEA